MLFGFFSSIARVRKTNFSFYHHQPSRVMEYHNGQGTHGSGQSGSLLMILILQFENIGFVVGEQKQSHDKHESGYDENNEVMLLESNILGNKS